MLFMPGAISQTIATFLFFVIVVGGGYAAGRIYFQKQKISQLEFKLEACESSLAVVDRKEGMLKKNLEVLQRSCGRQAEPVVKEGKFNIENLFKNKPM